MPGENPLKTAAYFEDRAKRSRRAEDKARFLAVARKYRARAEVARKREALERPDSRFGSPPITGTLAHRLIWV